MNIQEFFRPLVVEGGPGSGRRVNLQVRGQISGMRKSFKYWPTK